MLLHGRLKVLSNVSTSNFYKKGFAETIIHVTIHRKGPIDQIIARFTFTYDVFFDNHEKLAGV